ncbi:hypothetical protein DFH09DRAFT_1438795 [Mycena vulgaris]|nr:hypothetical protein DFH09DRAFT_1438795 [Mycena vulgaris]
MPSSSSTLSKIRDGGVPRALRLKSMDRGRKTRQASNLKTAENDAMTTREGADQDVQDAQEFKTRIKPSRRMKARLKLPRHPQDQDGAKILKTARKSSPHQVFKLQDNPLQVLKTSWTSPRPQWETFKYLARLKAFFKSSRCARQRKDQAASSLQASRQVSSLQDVVKSKTSVGYYHKNQFQEPQARQGASIKNQGALKMLKTAQGSSPHQAFKLSFKLRLKSQGFKTSSSLREIFMNQDSRPASRPSSSSRCKHSRSAQGSSPHQAFKTTRFKSSRRRQVQGPNGILSGIKNQDPLQDPLKPSNSQVQDLSGRLSRLQDPVLENQAFKMSRQLGDPSLGGLRRRGDSASRLKT